MKRILCVLVALFTVVGFHANANVNANKSDGGGGCACDENNLVVGPITLVQTSINCSTYDIQVPPVTGCLDVEISHSYFFQILDPNGFPVHSETSISPTIQYDFQFDTPGQYWILVTYTMTDDSQCIHTLPPAVETFNWLGCGNCACDPSNLALGPITLTGSLTDCSYTVDVPAVSGCESVTASSYYNFRVYNSSGALVFDQNETTNSTIFDFIYEPADVYTIIVTFTLVDNTGCTHTLSSVEETLDWKGCDTCSCDEDDLELGAITFIPSPSSCSSVVLNVPPVLGCSDVTASRNYNFKVYTQSGFLAYEVDESLDGTIFDFGSYPPGMFTIVVTFSMTDDSGCKHELPPVTALFDWTGCDCQNMVPPSVFDCDVETEMANTSQILTWNAVSAAVSYEVEVIYNDADCCVNPNNLPILTETYTRNINTLGLMAGRCFSWKVRSVCSDGSKSSWSAKQCSCETSGLGSPKSAIQSNEERITDESLKLTAVPNPATNHVDITMNGVLMDVNLNDTEMIIYDMAGRVIYRSEITLNETQRVDLSSFNSGVYLVNVINNGTLLSTEKLIVE